LTGGGHPLLPTPGEASLWDARSRQIVGAPIEHPQAVVSVAYSPDGGTFLTGCRDGQARLWDAARRIPLRTHLTPDAVLAVAYSHDGKVLLTGGASGFTGPVDGIARQWDARTGQRVGPDIKVSETIFGLDFSPDNRRILTGSSTFTAQVWDARTGAAAGKTFPHKQWIRAVAFSPDGRTVLTGSGDHTARLWDLATGKPLGPVLEHQDWVLGASFSPDRKLAVTASKDGSARIWPVGAPVIGDPERIRRWTEVQTGYVLDSDGNLSQLYPRAWLNRWQRLQAW
jgi:WD40 repeat protein